MRVIAIEGKGGPEALRLAERRPPTLGPEELRVRVHASALNRADLLQAMGQYPAPPGVPSDVPGLEYAGEVIEVGERARRFKVGERVMGLVGGGAFAEELVTHEREAIRVPVGMELTSAAAIPEAFLTAFDALVAQGGLRPGDWALLHAVTSGVGSAAAQVVKAFGARAIGTGRSPEKLGRVLPWLDTVLPVGTPPLFADAVRERTGGRGADVVLELVSGSSLPESVRAVAQGGRIMVVGLLGGVSAQVPLGLLMQRRASLIGTVLRSRQLEEKIALARRFERECLPLFESGALKPVVDQVHAMEDVRLAADRMLANASVGKLVLRW